MEDIYHAPPSKIPYVTPKLLWYVQRGMETMGSNEGPGVKDIWALVVRDPKSPALKASELLKVTDFA